MKNSTSVDEYPVCLDFAALPPTHNHVIGAVQAVSLDNIRGVLAIVHRLLQENNRNKITFGEDEVNGLSCILDNAIHALKFEQYWRSRPQESIHEPNR